MRIDTDINIINVEIDDVEYKLAEKTVAVAEKIAKAEKDYIGQPEYKYWLAMLEILLGKDAMKKLFKSGKNENIDRIERIYKGVIKAFNYNSEEAEEEQRQSRLEGISDALRPITELMKQANALSNQGDADKKIIRRN